MPSAGRVLVVDDDPLVRDSLVEELGASFEVSAASSGEEAIACLRLQRFDAVVSDVRMPGMGGVGLLREVAERSPEMVRVFLTGHADAEVYASACQTGAYKLTKPWGDELELVLRNALAHKRELDDARDEMLRRDKLVAVGAVAASVAHDLRSPLSVLKANDAYMRENPQASDVEQVCEDNREAIRMIEEVLNSLHGLVRSDTGVEHVLVRTAIERTVRLVRRLCQGSGVTLHVEIQGEPSVVAAPVELCQILLNLVSNAVQASPIGASVAIDAREVDDQVRVRVHDEGPGVGDAAALFSPGRSKKAGGLGLGLTITRELARRRGGDVRLCPGDGHGACFEVVLPSARAAVH